MNYKAILLVRKKQNFQSGLFPFQKSGAFLDKWNFLEQKGKLFCIKSFLLIGSFWSVFSKKQSFGPKKLRFFGSDHALHFIPKKPKVFLERMELNKSKAFFFLKSKDGY